MDRVFQSRRPPYGVTLSIGHQALLWALTAVLAQAPVHAQQAKESPQRLLLLGPMDAELVSRIHGQTADLPWQVQRLEAAAPRLQTAASLAREHDARAVLWAQTTTEGGLALALYDAASSRLLERTFELRDGGDVARSAAQEAFALAVRSSLGILAGGDPLGDPVELPPGEASESVGANPGSSEQPAVPEPPTDPPAPSSPGPGWELGLELEAGWAGFLDGASDPTGHGPWARAGVAVGWLTLAARGQLGLAADAATQAGPLLSVGRDLLLLELGAVIAFEAVWVRLAGAVGAARFRRRTLEVGPELARTPATATTLAAFEFGVELGVQLLGSRRIRLGLLLGLSALVVPEAPVLRTRTSTGVVDEPMWTISPALRLGPTLHFSP